MNDVPCLPCLLALFGASPPKESFPALNNTPEQNHHQDFTHSGTQSGLFLHLARLPLTCFGGEGTGVICHTTTTARGTDGGGYGG